MVGWHHRLNGHEFDQTPGVGDGQGGLACCSLWGRKESDMTERLTELSHPGVSAHRVQTPATEPGACLSPASERLALLCVGSAGLPGLQKESVPGGLGFPLWVSP